MNSRRRYLWLLFALILLPALVLAADHGAAHHEPGISDLKWYAINFTVFAVFLAALHAWLDYPLLAAWDARWRRIENDIAEGRTVLDDARRRLERAETGLREISARIEQLSERMRTETKREAAEIVAHARQRAEGIQLQTKHSVEAERRAAEQSVYDELIESVVRQTAEQLKARLTAEADRPRRLAAANLMGALLQ